MASLKLDIIPDLKQFSKAVGDVIRQKVKEAGGGGGGGGSSGEPKKQTGFLSGIFTRLGTVVGVLLSLKPIQDLLKIISGFVVLGFLEIVKIVKFIGYLAGLGWKTLFDYAKAAADYLKSLWPNIKTGLVEVWNKVTKAVQDAINWIVKLPANIWSFLKALPGQIWDFVKNLAQNIWTFMKTGFDSVVNWLAALPGSIWNFVKNLAGLIWGYVQKLPALIWGLLKDGFLWIKNEVVTAWNAIKALPSQIWSYMKNIGSMIASAVAGAIRSAFDFFGNLSKKSDKVGDAIIRPNGQVIKTDPQDTLIAMKNPGMGGSGGGGLGGSTMNFYGVTPQQVVDLVVSQLGQQSLRRTRL